jgi:limonene-1,2-epoxide hydrolase
MWKIIGIFVYLHFDGRCVFTEHYLRQQKLKSDGAKTKILGKDSTVEMIKLFVTSITFPFALHRLFKDGNEILMKILDVVGIHDKHFGVVWKVNFIFFINSKLLYEFTGLFFTDFTESCAQDDESVKEFGEE